MPVLQKCSLRFELSPSLNSVSSFQSVILVSSITAVSYTIFWSVTYWRCYRHYLQS